MNNRSNTIILILLISLYLSLITGCSSQAVVYATSTPTLSPSLPPTVALSATSKPPTEIPLTITLTSTPELVELNPSPRGYISMAYDSESGQVILFGGQTDGFKNNETWAYDVITDEWTIMNPSVSPPPGAAGSLIYDVESDRVILYGITYYLTPSRSTWAYDFNSNTWTEMSVQGPSRHLGSQMAYDVESDRVILFGGQAVSQGIYFDDTRVYDFNSDTWTKMEPTERPAGRNYHCMTYDTKADRVILWGGGGIGHKELPLGPSVWAYDFNTNTWEQRVYHNGPIINYYCAMAYSDAADRIVMYGGTNEGSSEMWVYDYNTNSWLELSPDLNPGELSRHAFVYIPDLDEFVLFGGKVGSDHFTQSTWIYDLKTNTWTETTRHE